MIEEQENKPIEEEVTTETNQLDENSNDLDTTDISAESKTTKAGINEEDETIVILNGYFIMIINSITKQINEAKAMTYIKYLI